MVYIFYIMFSNNPNLL